MHLIHTPTLLLRCYGYSHPTNEEMENHTWIILKRKPQAQKGVIYAKVHDAKPSLIPDQIAVSTSPGNIIIINQEGNLSLSPPHPHRKKRRSA